MKCGITFPIISFSDIFQNLLQTKHIHSCVYFTFNNIVHHNVYIYFCNDIKVKKYYIKYNA